MTEIVASVNTSHNSGESLVLNFLKNSMENPSVPGALLLFILLIALCVSSTEISISKASVSAMSKADNVILSRNLSTFLSAASDVYNCS